MCVGNRREERRRKGKQGRKEEYEETNMCIT
jgi:hypothetical protein